MIEAAFYRLFFGFINMLSRLPFGVLHRVSDGLYALIYYVIGYRKRLVHDNMKQSFPNKSPEELRMIRKQFYHHFADLMIESIKSSTMGQKEFRNRYMVKNWPVLEEILRTGESVIVVSPHTGNWEWVFSLVDRIPCTVYAIYQNLSNKYMDDYIRSTRQRFGAVMVPRKETYKKILGAIERKEQTLSWFAADQACNPNKAYWFNFLGRDTTFHRGYETIAKETGQKVLFLDIKKVKRSHYELEFIVISDHPAEANGGEIIEKFAHFTERRIREDPPYWLWTHNRWKHTKLET